MRTPTMPTPTRRSLNKDELRWRAIISFALVYITAVVALNWRTYVRVRSGNASGKTRKQHAGNEEFRPPLWRTEMPSLSSLRMSAKIVDPDLFQGLPDAFDDNYRNPCWHDSEQKMHCLPFFYVFSSFQSGIWDLQAKMQRHPHIARAANPQPHFWAEKRPTKRMLDVMDAAVGKIKANPSTHIIGDWSASTFPGYWAMQPRVHQAFYRVKASCWNKCKNLKDSEEHRRERIECVTEKCYKPSQKEDRAEAEKAGLEYEQMQTPLLMRTAYGSFKPKIVVVLRNPVDRVHSAFWTYGHYWERYGGKSAEGFQRYVTEQIEGFRNCTDVVKASPFSCALYLESLNQYLEDIFFHCDQLMRGMYSVWLHIWMSFFPKDSFLIVKAEEYFQQPRQTLSRAFEHVGLREPTEAEWDDILSVSEIRTAARGKEMLPEAQALVTKFYEPFNKDLAALLGGREMALEQLAHFAS